VLLDMAVSTGVALSPEHGTSTEALLRGARQALQHAKAAGGDTWRICGQDESDLLRKRMLGREELSHAIENGLIIPYYQPIVTLPANTVSKFEVLARWNHPTLGMLEPEHFIPLAEEVGLSGVLSMALLKQVAIDMQAWPDHCRFAINASAGQLRELITFVRDQPGDWQRRMDISRLDVEMTENALMRDRKLVAELIDVLHANGARAGLDNFGNGFSNFFHLRELNFDTLKIGKNFIADMLTDPRAESCVMAMMWLSHGLGIQMIADGVENGDVAARLAKMGCHFAQGFHYAHPVPADEVEDVLHVANRTVARVMA
jgi:EAL domain-containing protein (putative c-di-GMP-specific phosphodiesterase class I)